MGPDLEYVLASGIWSLVGLFVGYALGRIERDVQTINKRLDEKEKS